MVDVIWVFVAACAALLFGLWAGEKEGIQKGRREEWRRRNGVFKRDWR